MKCQYCGTELKGNEKYCINCGNNLTLGNEIPNQENNTFNYPNKTPAKNSPALIMVVIVITIISLTVISNIIFTMATFDSYSKVESSTNEDNQEEDIKLYDSINNVLGTWNCSNSKNSKEYIITFKLKDDMTFIWNKYGDEKNNHVYGNFEFTDLMKKNNSGEISYYLVKIIGEEYIYDGVLQTEAYMSEYEMGVNIKEFDSAILTNTKTSNIYYCYID